MDRQRKITPAQWAAVAALWALAVYGIVVEKPTARLETARLVACLPHP